MLLLSGSGCHLAGRVPEENAVNVPAVPVVAPRPSDDKPAALPAPSHVVQQAAYTPVQAPPASPEPRPPVVPSEQATAPPQVEPLGIELNQAGPVQKAPATAPILEPGSERGPSPRSTGVDRARLPQATGEPTRQSVDYFIGMALANHPSITAARARVAAEANRIPQASALPDPVFSNTFWPLHDQALQTAAGRVGNQMSISQQVPWPEKLRSRAAVVSREVQIAQAEVERIEREVTESVRLAYYEVWYATRAIAIVEETQQLVGDLLKVSEARYRSGGSQQDVIRAQLENDRLEDQLITLTKQKEMAQADLAALLQQPLHLVPEVVDTLDVSNTQAELDTLIGRAEECNPTLRGLLWELRRDREKQRLACLQQYPDLQFGMHWGLINDDDNVVSPVANGHDNISFTVGTTLPIWHDKIDAGVREAALRTSSTTQRLEAERDAIYGKLRRLVSQADALVAQRAIFKDRMIPRIEDTLRLAFSDYRGQRADFYSLIETYRELLLYETQVARIEANLAGIVAQIDRTVGCPE